LWKKSPENWRSKLFKRRIVNFFLITIPLILTPFLTGCQKKPPAEAADVHRGIKAAIEDCATVYAQEELAALDIMLLEMDALKEKRKYKKMREKALHILPHIEILRAIVEQEKKALQLQIEKEKERAAESIRSALENQAIDYAPNLMVKAKNLFGKGEQFQDDHGCQLSKSLDFFHASAQAAEKAKIRVLEEHKKLEELEEAKKRLEEKKIEEAVKPKKEIAEWIVASGENLWTISSKDEVYGNPLLWALLFWANRSQIKDPHLIYQNQKLKIPREFQQEDLEKARKTAYTISKTSERD
jgi:hypothetical protein